MHSQDLGESGDLEQSACGTTGIDHLEGVAVLRRFLLLGDERSQATGVDERHLGHVQHEGSDVVVLIEPVIEDHARRSIDFPREHHPTVTLSDL